MAATGGLGGAVAELDAAVQAMVDGPSAAADGPTAAPHISAESLDAILAETAQELAAAEEARAELESFDDFADAATVLGEMVVAPDINLDEESLPHAAGAGPGAMTAPGPTKPGALPVATAEAMTAVIGTNVAAAEETAPEPEPEPQIAPAATEAAARLADEQADADAADFASPDRVLAAINDELSAATGMPADAAEAAVSETLQADARPGPSEATAAAPTAGVGQADRAPTETREPVAEIAAVGGDAAPAPVAIEQLDQVLAEKAETVLEETGQTPRVAGAAVAPEPAPAPPPPSPAAVAPAPAPIAPAPAPSPSPAPPPEPVKPRRRLAPTLAAIAERSLMPLAAVTSRVPVKARQTIGFLAVVTLFNCTWVWGIVLFRSPAAAPAAAGHGTPFLKPGDPVPEDHGHSGEHGGKADSHGAKPEAHGAPAKDDGHGGSHAPAKKKDDGHGGHGAESKAKDDGHGGHGSSAKKKDDGHGKTSKTTSRTKKKKASEKQEAAAGHH